MGCSRPWAKVLQAPTYWKPCLRTGNWSNATPLRRCARTPNWWWTGAGASCPPSRLRILMPDQPSVTRPRMFGLTPAEKTYLAEVDAGIVRGDVERLLGII